MRNHTIDLTIEIKKRVQPALRSLNHILTPALMLVELDRSDKIAGFLCLVFIRIGKNISRAANPADAMILAEKRHQVFLSIL